MKIFRILHFSFLYVSALFLYTSAKSTLRGSIPDDELLKTEVKRKMHSSRINEQHSTSLEENVNKDIESTAALASKLLGHDELSGYPIKSHQNNTGKARFHIFKIRSVYVKKPQKLRNVKTKLYDSSMSSFPPKFNRFRHIITNNQENRDFYFNPYVPLFQRHNSLADYDRSNRHPHIYRIFDNLNFENRFMDRRNGDEDFFRKDGSYPGNKFLSKFDDMPHDDIIRVPRTYSTERNFLLNVYDSKFKDIPDDDIQQDQIIPHEMHTAMPHGVHQDMIHNDIQRNAPYQIDKATPHDVHQDMTHDDIQQDKIISEEIHPAISHDVHRDMIHNDIQQNVPYRIDKATYGDAHQDMTHNDFLQNVPREILYTAVSHDVYQDMIHNDIQQVVPFQIHKAMSRDIYKAKTHNDFQQDVPHETHNAHYDIQDMTPNGFPLITLPPAGTYSAGQNSLSTYNNETGTFSNMHNPFDSGSGYTSNNMSSKAKNTSQTYKATEDNATVDEVVTNSKISNSNMKKKIPNREVPFNFTKEKERGHFKSPDLSQYEYKVKTVSPLKRYQGNNQRTQRLGQDDPPIENLKLWGNNRVYYEKVPLNLNLSWYLYVNCSRDQCQFTNSTNETELLNEGWILHNCTTYGCTEMYPKTESVQKFIGLILLVFSVCVLKIIVFVLVFYYCRRIKLSKGEAGDFIDPSWDKEKQKLMFEKNKLKNEPEQRRRHSVELEFPGGSKFGTDDNRNEKPQENRTKLPANTPFEAGKLNSKIWLPPTQKVSPCLLPHEVNSTLWIPSKCLEKKTSMSENSQHVLKFRKKMRSNIPKLVKRHSETDGIKDHDLATSKVTQKKEEDILLMNLDDEILTENIYGPSNIESVPNWESLLENECKSFISLDFGEAESFSK